MDVTLKSFIEQYDYIAVALLMLVENIFPPIPSELVLPLAGMAVAKQGLHLVIMLLSASAGSLAGAYFWYWVGRWVGEARVRYFIKHHGRWLTVSLNDYERAERFFHKHARTTVFLGRLVPTIRTVVSVPAGLFAMSQGRLLFFSALGTCVWSALLLYAGYALGENADIAERYIGYASNGILLMILLWYIWRLITAPKTKPKT